VGDPSTFFPLLPFPDRGEVFVALELGGEDSSPGVEGVVFESEDFEAVVGGWVVGALGEELGG